MNRKKTVIWLLMDILLLIIVVFEICILAEGKTGIFRKRDSSGETAVKVEAEKIEAVPSVAPSSEPEQTPVPTRKPKYEMTAKKFQKNVESILTDADGIWEVYISDLSGEVAYQKNSGKNMIAGDSLYFFMAEQVYSDIRQGNLDNTAARKVEEVIGNRDTALYKDMIGILYDTSLTLDEADRFVLEKYPFTFWEVYEEVGYTSSNDGVKLMKNIVNAAKYQDPYARKELKYLEEGWNQGNVADVTGKGEVLELFSGQYDRMEDFAVVSLADGKGYLIGVMAEEISDVDMANKIVRNIAKLSQKFYSSSEAE